MPRPRFEKLAPEKRERILETAAQEFAAYGYEGASLNQILERAEMSKGAVYYYFDDKADLFATVVQHYSRQLLAAFEFSLDELTAETFWPAITKVYRQQFDFYDERPWMLGVIKAASSLPLETLAAGPLGEFVQQLQQWLAALLAKGQVLGVVRADLPDDLLLSLVAAIDDASDRWLLAHWHTLETAEIDTIVGLVLNTLHHVLAPPPINH